ncbi:activity-regulated cytoskeleton associated protein 2-like [Rhagoletis pomonella]|uniref:activity-regulated cytoskeleton associated protein 2-like n=1 Tax=Rhagoletis pomonella TaxID=28610 RepID=UPI0017871AD3|nr:activity-regulated cytoskeleton associated protein 2-like [Rhagoletis pomonella]
MATFSPEPFSQILEAISSGGKNGSFTQCTSRFTGQWDPVAVEEFVAAITVFKDIEKIPDADALRGMPLLLEDYAATWWIGVKESVSTFTDAIELKRATFSPPTPDWKT